jgi:hypothetical protein
MYRVCDDVALSTIIRKNFVLEGKRAFLDRLLVDVIRQRLWVYITTSEHNRTVP